MCVLLNHFPTTEHTATSNGTSNGNDNSNNSTEASPSPFLSPIASPLPGKRMKKMSQQEQEFSLKIHKEMSKLEEELQEMSPHLQMSNGKEEKLMRALMTSFEGRVKRRGDRRERGIVRQIGRS